MWDTVVFGDSSGLLQIAKEVKGRAFVLTVISSHLSFCRCCPVREMELSHPFRKLVELEPDCQLSSPALATLGVAVNWQHFWWAFIKGDVFLEVSSLGHFSP